MQSIGKTCWSADLWRWINKSLFPVVLKLKFFRLDHRFVPTSTMKVSCLVLGIREIFFVNRFLGNKVEGNYQRYDLNSWLKSTHSLSCNEFRCTKKGFTLLPDAQTWGDLLTWYYSYLRQYWWTHICSQFISFWDSSSSPSPTLIHPFFNYI